MVLRQLEALDGFVRGSLGEEASCYNKLKRRAMRRRLGVLIVVLAYYPLFLPIPVAVFFGSALVIILFTLGNTNFAFH